MYMYIYNNICNMMMNICTVMRDVYLHLHYIYIDVGLQLHGWYPSPLHMHYIYLHLHTNFVSNIDRPINFLKKA